MTAQLQYRRNDNDQTNVFPGLGGTNTGSSLAVPVTLNIVHKRILHNVTVNFSRTQSSSLQPVRVRQRRHGERRHRRRLHRSVRLGGAAALVLQPLEPARRNAVAAHRLTAHAGLRLDAPVAEAHPAGRRGRSSRQHEQPDGHQPERRVRLHRPVFVGRRGPDSKRRARLRRFPARVSRSRPRCSTVPARSSCAGKSLSLYLQDDWRKSASLTFNLGVRYELLWPYVEENGQMVNLDVNSDFTAAVPVLSGETGPFSGRFPQGPDQSRHEQRRAARRLRVADEARHDPARRLRHQLQLRLVLDDRPAARRPAAVRRRRTPASAAPARRSSSAIRSSPRCPTRRPTPTASTTTTVSASCRHGTPTCLATSARPGTSAPATPKPAAPASTSSARRIAILTASASRACSRSCGRHRKDRPFCTPARSGFGAARSRASASATSYTLAQVARQRVVARRRRDGRGPERSGPGRRVGALELRPASPADGRHEHRAAVRPEPPVAERRRDVGRRCSATGG